MAGDFTIQKKLKPWVNHIYKGGSFSQKNIDHISIYNGCISGTGEDDEGAFTIIGSVYNGRSVQFIEKYECGQTIFYSGTLNEDGIIIDGDWTLDGKKDKFQLIKDYEDNDTLAPPPNPALVTPLPITNYPSNDYWKGFFEQNGEKTEMIFSMFSAKPGNQITGAGSDKVGSFHLFGTCDSNGNALFTKQYDGQHPVAY